MTRGSLGRIIRLTFLLTGALVALGASAASAQDSEGRIVGRVLSAETGEPLSNAQVLAIGGEVGTLTSLDGRYVLRGVPAGTRELQIQLIGYRVKTVTGVRVTAGETTVLDVSISPQAVELEGITVTVAAERGATTALLTERKLASTVSDAIGREQMARSPDGDAAAALKRVPGLSVMDGRFALVRGLGERYSMTTLNGAPLASPVPDKKVIPLDVFPSDLLESIVTTKTYAADQPGDYAGGLVRLRTRDFPPNRIFSLSAGTSWNSEATFASALGYHPGDNLDFLGFPGNSRSLPETVPVDEVVSGATLSPDELERIGESFRGDWGPRVEKLPANASFGVTYGDDFDFDDDERLGLIASANYSSNYSFRDDQIERVFQLANVEDPEVDYRGDLATHSVQWGGLVNVTYQPTGRSQLTFSGVYNRMVDDLSRVFQGFNLDKNTDQRNTRLQYIATTMTNLQLRGDHTLGFFADAELGWRAGFTAAERYEPNTREVLYQRVGDRFIFDDFVLSGSLFHQDQDEDGVNGGLEMTFPLGSGGRSGNLGLGMSTDRKDRATFTRRFRFRPDRGSNTILTTEVLSLPPNELLVGRYIGPDGFRIEESTFRTDNYDASQNVDAAFVTFDGEPWERLRVSVGARVERFEQMVTPHDLFPNQAEPLPAADLEATDVLPAVNLTVAITDEMNVRAGLSQTLARPQLRELAPFAFADYAGGYLVLGNPGLDRSRIKNFDLRWEWFPSPAAVVAVSGFYKHFTDPIEAFVLPSTEPIRSWVNAPGARNWGAEFELRGDLGPVLTSLAGVELNGNLTLVRSMVEFGGATSVFVPGSGQQDIVIPDRDRALEGQSPYVVNLGLSWSDVDRRTSASVLFNRHGERINAVGAENAPDLVEEARSSLDATLERSFGSFDVKVSGNRLLGSEVSFIQGGALLRRYDLGRTVSFGVSWKPLD